MANSENALNQEIESKFLVNRFPTEVEPISVVQIDQTYLGIGSGDELRVRKMRDLKTNDVRYTFAFKKGSKENRLEFEQDISKELYEHVTGNTRAIPLKKVRTTVPYEDVLIEIDQYDVFPFVVAEVEFPNAEEMEHFTPPTWCIEEISDDKTYANRNLWKLIQK